jgi:hypothetical protein
LKLLEFGLFASTSMFVWFIQPNAETFGRLLSLRLSFSSSSSASSLALFPQSPAATTLLYTTQLLARRRL